MSTKDLLTLIGRHGTVTIACADLRLTGRIDDVKQAYGNLRYVVAIDGQAATVVVNAESFAIDKEKK